MDHGPSVGLRGQVGFGNTHSVEALDVGDVPVDEEVHFGGHVCRTSTRTPRARNKRHVRSDVRALEVGVVVGGSASALMSGVRAACTTATPAARCTLHLHWL